MSKRSKQKKGEQERELLENYSQELMENLNLRMLCEQESNIGFQGSILWVEKMILTDFECYESRKHTILETILSAFSHIWKVNRQRRSARQEYKK